MQPAPVDRETLGVVHAGNALRRAPGTDCRLTDIQKHHRVLFRRLQNLCVCPEALEIRVNMGAPVGHMFRTDATEEITDNETLLPSRSDSPCHPVQAPGTRFMDGVTEDSGTEPHPVRRVCPCKARPRLESRACQELTSRRSSLSSIPAEHASRVSGVLSQSAVVAGVSAARHRRPFPVRGRPGPYVTTGRQPTPATPRKEFSLFLKFEMVGDDGIEPPTPSV